MVCVCWRRGVSICAAAFSLEWDTVVESDLCLENFRYKDVPSTLLGFRTNCRLFFILYSTDWTLPLREGPSIVQNDPHGNGVLPQARLSSDTCCLGNLEFWRGDAMPKSLVQLASCYMSRGACDFRLLESGCCEDWQHRQELILQDHFS